ncbi:DUF3048 domain-containing protein [Flexivirga endophytica]|uniref:DUF3048 domain-containing protein n=1 Tax=Flexivirga endophytica TaxID=1849103 RepID=UPI001668DCEA|nr:DUF3048 domain-containing protein [Flexivirga endophytica]
MTRNTRRRHLIPTAVALLALVTAGCSGGGSGTMANSTDSPSGTRATDSKSASASTRSSAPPSSPKKPSTSALKPSGNPLTGGAKTGNPVIAVKLENTRAAMPQYGLSPADLVFVEQVEGNLTRLMPIYQTSFPKRVEPVRSARSTDADILPAFGHPALVYSGAASQIRKKLSKAPIRLFGSGSRDSGRQAPHNLYVDVAKLSHRPGLPSSKDIGLRFAASDARLQRALADPSFTVRVGADRFSFSYKGNRYLPTWNGRPYKDVGAGGKPVTASNVLTLDVHQVSDHYKDPAGNPVDKSLTTGSGKLTLHRNGKKLVGTWHRSATNKPFVLKDSHGKQLELAPGKTWILLRGR